MINNIYKYEYELARNLIIRFENQLSNLGLKLKEDSVLYNFGFEILLTGESNEYFRDSYNDGNDNRPLLRRAIGLSNFIDKLYPLLKSSEIASKILPHLELLNESSIPQNIKSKVTDQGANKLIELYFASICFQLFSDVELDHPENSKGDNPDITFYHNRCKWAIACKTPHSENPKSIFENIKSGINQIESSDAHKGFVLINLKNLIDHNKLWEVKKIIKNGIDFYSHESYYNPQELYDNLKKQSIIIKDKIFSFIGEENISGLYFNKKTIPATVFFSQTVASVMHDNTKVLALQNLIALIQLNVLDKSSFEMIDSIDKELHRINYNMP